MLAHLTGMASEKELDLLSKWLQLYELTLKPNAGIDEPKDAYSLKLRKLMRTSYLDLPLTLLVLADHAVRVDACKHANTPCDDSSLWQEKREVFLPLLYMLGMWALRRRWVEDCAQHLQTEEYHRMDHRLARTSKQRIPIYQYFQKQIHQQGFDVIQRAIKPGKALHHHHQGTTIEELESRLDIDVITGHTAECYLALGAVHKLGTTIRGSFYDYIVQPLSNGYRALHTSLAVEEPAQSIVNVRIYSNDMGIVNQYGVTASNSQAEGVQAWWNQQLPASHPLYRRDINEYEQKDKSIYMFTPRGEAIILEAGSTAIDFAYRVHTQIGHHCRTISVNGQSANYDTKLYNGDLIEIKHDPLFPGPHPSWLNMAHNKHTREKIKRGLGLAGHVKHPGRQRLEKYLQAIEKESGVVIPEPQVEQYLTQVARELKLGNHQHLYEALENPKRYRNTISIDKLVVYILERELSRAILTANGKPLVEVEPQATVRFCPGCKPTPASPILLHRRLLKSGKQLFTVHRAQPSDKQLYGLPSSKALSCVNSLKKKNVSLDNTYRWGEASTGRRMMNVTVLASNRSGLLGDLLKPIYDDERLDLQRVQAAAGTEGMADIMLSVEYQSMEHIIDLQTRLEQTDNVIRASLWPVSLTQQAHLKSRHAGRLSNPYNLGTPQIKSSLFFGREEEVQCIRSFLDDRLPLVILYGQRRCGKTSLARQLEKKLSGYPCIPIYVDFQYCIDDLSPANVYFQIACTIQRTLFARTPDHLPLSLQAFTADPFNALQNYLQQSQALITPRRLLILLDEFNLLVAREPDSPIFYHLRTSVSALSDITFLLITHTSQYRGFRTSPAALELYSQSQALALKSLDEIAAKELVRKPTQGAVEFEEETVSQLVLGTNNNPYLIHILCYHIIDQFEREGRTYVRVEDLHNIVQNCLFRGGQTYFSFIFSQIAEQKNALPIVISIAQRQGKSSHWVDLQEVAEQVDIGLSELGMIIDYMELCGILVSRESPKGRRELRLPIQYFCDWVDENPVYFRELAEQVYEQRR
ncbi:MAG: TGS domain-containing protein [Nitrososphaera sp.]|nr:TGS domain-containing protein [Nitrososphaera sp.]